jgi:cytidylate kinase
LKQKGIESKLSQLVAEISERDERDSQRSVAPLKPAEDAFMLDSTGLNIETVYTQVRDYCTATK